MRTSSVRTPSVTGASARSCRRRHTAWGAVGCSCRARTRTTAFAARTPITSPQISNVITPGAVTNGAITAGAVTDGAITDGAITDGAVTDGEITDGEITDWCGVGRRGHRGCSRGRLDHRRRDPGWRYH